MGCVTESQFRTIQTAFRSILEIGQDYPDDSYSLVFAILQKLDCSLVPPSLKERTIEILATEHPSTMEDSLNTALRKHFLPQIPPPLSLPNSAPSLLLQKPSEAAKVEHKESMPDLPSSLSLQEDMPLQTVVADPKESKSDGPSETIWMPPVIAELAAVADLSLSTLKNHLQLIKINGRPCAILSWPSDPASELTTFFELANNAAEKGSLALLREGVFVHHTRPGQEYGLDFEKIYLLSRIIVFCINKREDDPELIKGDQIEFLKCYYYSRELDFVIADLFELLEKDIATPEAAKLFIQLQTFIAKNALLIAKKVSAEEHHAQIREFRDPHFWSILCPYLLKAASIRFHQLLTQASTNNIIKFLKSEDDEKTREALFQEVVVEMRDGIFAEAALAHLPSIPDDLFIIFYMGELHQTGFLDQLSTKSKVEFL